jgi:hypothetical protein
MLTSAKEPASASAMRTKDAIWGEEGGQRCTLSLSSLLSLVFKVFFFVGPAAGVFF